MGSRNDKQIERLKTIPSDYTYSEARALLTRLGFVEMNKGRTSGSRVIFYRETDGKQILLHKPHPGNEMKTYAVREMFKKLVEYGDINE